ncbi:MAG: hypothetical protein WDN30_16465 [Pararobbsia sp.]
MCNARGGGRIRSAHQKQPLILTKDVRNVGERRVDVVMQSKISDKSLVERLKKFDAVDVTVINKASEAHLLRMIRNHWRVSCAHSSTRTRIAG